MRKLRNAAGFTLVEMLACIAVMVLIGMICTTGMQFALKSYQQSLYESDSQMLEDTLNLYIGDILRHATSIETETIVVDGNQKQRVTEFTNEEYQIYHGNMRIAGTADGFSQSLLICDSQVGGPFIIAGEKVYAKTLYIEDFALEYNKDTGIFTGSYKIKSTVLETAVRECTFTFRTIATY